MLKPFQFADGLNRGWLPFPEQEERQWRIYWYGHKAAELKGYLEPDRRYPSKEIASAVIEGLFMGLGQHWERIKRSFESTWLVGETCQIATLGGPWVDAEVLGFLTAEGIAKIRRADGSVLVRRAELLRRPA